MKRLFNSIGNESSLVFFFTYIFTLDALGLCVFFLFLFMFFVLFQRHEFKRGHTLGAMAKWI